MANLPREQLDDISTQRFQDNVATQLKKDSTQPALGSMGSNIKDLGNNTFSVDHALGTEPKGFVLLSHATAGSIKTSIVKSTANNATLSFGSAPGTFTVYFY